MAAHAIPGKYGSECNILVYNILTRCPINQKGEARRSGRQATLASPTCHEPFPVSSAAPCPGYPVKCRTPCTYQLRFLARYSASFARSSLAPRPPVGLGAEQQESTYLRCSHASHEPLWSPRPHLVPDVGSSVKHHPHTMYIPATSTQLQPEYPFRHRRRTLSWMSGLAPRNSSSLTMGSEPRYEATWWWGRTRGTRGREARWKGAAARTCSDQAKCVQTSICVLQCFCRWFKNR